MAWTETVTSEWPFASCVSIILTHDLKFHDSATYVASSLLSTSTKLLVRRIFSMFRKFGFRGSRQIGSFYVFFTGLTFSNEKKFITEEKAKLLTLSATQVKLRRQGLNSYPELILLFIGMQSRNVDNDAHQLSRAWQSQKTTMLCSTPSVNLTADDGIWGELRCLIKNRCTVTAKERM